MEFKIKLSELEKVVNTFNILKEAKNNFEDKIFISATSNNQVFFRVNLQSDILVKGKAVVKEEGSAVCLLDAKELKSFEHSIFRGSIDEDAEINFKKVNETFKVTIDGTEFDYPVSLILIANADNLIQVNVDTEEAEMLSKYIVSKPANTAKVMEINGTELKAKLKAVLTCIDPGEILEGLTCVLMKAQDNRLTLVGTNGIKLHEVAIRLQNIEADVEAMVPFRCASSLKRLLNGGNVQIGIKNGHLYFDMGEIVVAGKLEKDAEYPSYSKFFDNPVGCTFKLSTDELRTVVKRIAKHTDKQDNYRLSVFAKDNEVIFKTEKGLELHSVGFHLDVIGEMDCDLNAVRLLELLKWMAGGILEIRLSKSNHYLTIHSENGEQRALLVPLRRRKDEMTKAVDR